MPWDRLDFRGTLAWPRNSPPAGGGRAVRPDAPARRARRTSPVASGRLSRPRVRAGDHHAAYRDHPQAGSRVDGDRYRSGAPSRSSATSRSTRTIPPTPARSPAGSRRRAALRRGDGRCAVREIQGDLLRARGFYEARATHTVDLVDDGAIVRVMIDRGPHVSVAFSGDPLRRTESAIVSSRFAPRHRRTRTCSKTRAARSRITSTHAAIVMPTLYAREETPGELTVRFTISRGTAVTLVDDVPSTATPRFRRRS